jgi:putative transposase
MAYLWRAVDSEGEVLDVLVQSRRNKRAALKLMRKLLKKYALSQTSWSRRYKNRSASQGRMLRVFLELAMNRRRLHGLGQTSVPRRRNQGTSRRTMGLISTFKAASWFTA